MIVRFELRCPKCRGFVSGFEKCPGMVRGYCRKCPMRFESMPEPVSIDTTALRIRTYA